MMSSQKFVMIPMGLTSDDITNKRYFEFNYLQSTGLGTRSLCLPAVSRNFKWNGQQVASLAKSGAEFIYILATTDLPGCNSLEIKVGIYTCITLHLQYSGCVWMQYNLWFKLA